MTNLYLGMISGTSVDGVDCVIVDFAGGGCRLAGACTYPYPVALRKRIEGLIRAPQVALAGLGALDIACGRFFAECALALIRKQGFRPIDITAIGHHGQTVFHEPDGSEPFSLQIGDASTVAAMTGIPTVGHIRAMDMALGGQGAPMVPAFHAWRFASADEARIIVNIGGIANLTILAPDTPVTGFDTGPGNTLMNLWVERCRQQAYDENGTWAATGSPIPRLLDAMLGESYFSRQPPKSTGRELFNAGWLDRHIADGFVGAAPEDVQATLAELTALTIANAVTETKPGSVKLIVCGGGAHNSHLLTRLALHHDGPVTTTEEVGLDPDWVEAAAFAWLARARIRNEHGNLPTVTGARQAAVLGGLYSRDTP